MSREAQLEEEWKHWKVNLQIFSRESYKQQLPLSDFNSPLAEETTVLCFEQGLKNVKELVSKKCCCRVNAGGTSELQKRKVSYLEHYEIIMSLNNYPFTSALEQ